MTQPTIEPNMTLEQAARKAAEIFRWYEQLHAAKPDMEKAKRNAEFAEMLERALTAQAGDANRLPLDEFERGRQYGLKEALNCVCDIHKRFAKNQAAWDAISQAQKAINMKRVQVKRAAIAAAKGE